MRLLLLLLSLFPGLLLLPLALAATLQPRSLGSAWHWLHETPKKVLPVNPGHPEPIKPPPVHSPPGPSTPSVWHTPDPAHLAPPPPPEHSLPDPHPATPPGTSKDSPGFHPGKSPLAHPSSPAPSLGRASLAEHLAAYEGAGPYIVSFAQKIVRERQASRSAQAAADVASGYQESINLVRTPTDRFKSLFAQAASDVRKAARAAGPATAAAWTKVANVLQAMRDKTSRAWQSISAAIQRNSNRIKALFQRQPRERTIVHQPEPPPEKAPLPKGRLPPRKVLPREPIRGIAQGYVELGKALQGVRPNAIRQELAEMWEKMTPFAPNKKSLPMSPLEQEKRNLEKNEFVDAMSPFLTNLRRYALTALRPQMDMSSVNHWTFAFKSALVKSVDTSVSKAVELVARERLPSVLRGPELEAAQTTCSKELSDVWNGLSSPQKQSLLKASGLGDKDESKLLASAADLHLPPPELDKFVSQYSGNKVTYVEQVHKQRVDGLVGSDKELSEQQARQFYLDLTPQKLQPELLKDPQFSDAQMLRDLVDYKKQKVAEKWADTLHSQFRTDYAKVLGAPPPATQDRVVAESADALFAEPAVCQLLNEQIFHVKDVDVDFPKRLDQAMLNGPELERRLDDFIRSNGAKLTEAGIKPHQLQVTQASWVTGLIKDKNLIGTDIGKSIEAILDNPNNVRQAVDSAKEQLSQLRSQNFLTETEWHSLTEDLEKTKSVTSCQYKLRELRTSKFVEAFNKAIGLMSEQKQKSVRSIADSYLRQATPVEVRQEMNSHLRQGDLKSAFGALSKDPLTPEEREAFQTKELMKQAFPGLADLKPTPRLVGNPIPDPVDTKKWGEQATDIFFDTLGVKQADAEKKFGEVIDQVDNPGGSALGKFDWRQAMLRDNNRLRVNDPRLKGTPFEFLDDATIKEFNSQADYMVNNLPMITEQTAGKEAALSELAPTWDRIKQMGLEDAALDTLDDMLKRKKPPDTRTQPHQ